MPHTDNATSPSDPAPSDHLRYEVGQLEKLRAQIFSDMEMLRQQEQNLRTYESRLRGIQPTSGATVAPFVGDSHDMAAAREKLSRQRALLEAERRALTDERIALREEKAAVAAQLEGLKQREAWITLRERELKAQSFPPPPAAVPKKTASASPFGLRLGFNEVPFAGYFRSDRRSA